MIKNVKGFIKENGKRLYAIAASGVVTTALASTAYAESDWGVNTKTWVNTQASALGLCAIAVILVPLIVKKMWAAMFGVIFGGGVALYFINNPDQLNAIGAAIKKIVFGG